MTSVTGSFHPNGCHTSPVASVSLLQGHKFIPAHLVGNIFQIRRLTAVTQRNVQKAIKSNGAIKREPNRPDAGMVHFEYSECK